MQREWEARVHCRSWRMVGIEPPEACFLICAPGPPFHTSLPSRNLAERCPGDQTNNRAELIVCPFLPGPMIHLTNTFQGNPASLGNRTTTLQEVHDNTHRFPVLYKLSALLQII
jgi:hypothetical protein